MLNSTIIYTCATYLVHWMDCQVICLFPKGLPMASGQMASHRHKTTVRKHWTYSNTEQSQVLISDIVWCSDFVDGKSDDMSSNLAEEKQQQVRAGWLGNIQHPLATLGLCYSLNMVMRRVSEFCDTGYKWRKFYWYTKCRQLIYNTWGGEHIIASQEWCDKMNSSPTFSKGLSN